MAEADTPAVPSRAAGTSAAPDLMEELTESECWRLLRTVDVGRIAMAVAGGGVELFPINFVVDHGTIVFRTASGTKLSHVEQCAVVAFEADDADEVGGTAWSVVVKGEARTIQGRTAVFDSFDIDLRPWHDSNKPFFVRLEPQAVTGRRFVRRR